MFDPYHGIRKDKLSVLRKYGYTPAQVRAGLKNLGVTLKAWSESHGWKASTVSLAANGKRASVEDEKIVRELCRALDARDAELREEMACKEKVWVAMGREIERLKRRLKRR